MEAKIIRSDDAPVTDAPWGALQWLVSSQNGTSGNMTLGRVSIKPGQNNPPHHHPNCEEVLYVEVGEIEHTLPQGGSTRLGPGDCIVLPQGSTHQAKNVGDEDAVVIVAFNAGDRQTIGE